MAVAREEIFGPVVSVITFETEEEAVRIANDTPYGLSGSLWTRDGARQLRVARALRTGAIGVNSNSSVFPQAPFGGYKASGVGKELGMEGLVHNTELKSVFVSTEPRAGRGAGRRPSRSVHYGVGRLGRLGERLALLVALLLLAGAPFADSRSRAIFAIVVCRFDAIRYLRCLVSDVIGDPRQRFTARDARRRDVPDPAAGARVVPPSATRAVDPRDRDRTRPSRAGLGSAERADHGSALTGAEGLLRRAHRVGRA